MSSLKPRVLVVDDDEEARHLVEASLPACECRGVGSAEKALEAAWSFRPDLLILDLTLPGFGGQALLRMLRSEGRLAGLPVLVVTGDEREKTLLEAFGSGADDFLTKPFSPAELAARARALLRRAKGELLPERLEAKGVVLDLGRHVVVLNGKEARLTPTEFHLLRLLMEKAGRVLSREYLLECLFGSSDTRTRALDIHFHNLRRKMGPLSRLIETVREFGYRFRV